MAQQKQLVVGDSVPMFTLPSSTGQPVTLADHLANGPVVLAWYLFDFGRVWRIELEGFRENHDRLVGLGASVLGMCVESDRAHTAFAQMLDIPFPLLSDFNRKVVYEFGIAYTEDQPFSGFWGMSKRSVFVVDRAGVVRYVWVTDDPLIAPDVEAVVQAVAALG